MISAFDLILKRRECFQIGQIRVDGYKRAPYDFCPPTLGNSYSLIVYGSDTAVSI